jgi:hypothetical protein
MQCNNRLWSGSNNGITERSQDNKLCVQVYKKYGVKNNICPKVRG